MMKYMTFHSSCAYAGVANMLELLGHSTEDRIIAVKMSLPYLFTGGNGRYYAGPMLQSAGWFRLYLLPNGFEMNEAAVPAPEVPAFLRRQKTAMLGVRVSETDKHAIVYVGEEDGRLCFRNNKWRGDPAPVSFLFSEEELISRLDESAVVATLRPCPAQAVDVRPLLTESLTVLERMYGELSMFCARLRTPEELRAALDPLFRPLFLDGISMTELIGQTELCADLTKLQGGLMELLRADEPAVPSASIPMPALRAAVERYAELIRAQAALPGGPQ